LSFIVIVALRPGASTGVRPTRPPPRIQTSCSSSPTFLTTTRTVPAYGFAQSEIL